MSELKLINDLNDLKYLRELYRKSSPNNTHGFYTLNNFTQWFELNPKLDHVKVYVANNWKENGFFIILDRYQLFINSLSSNVDVAANALKLWDWTHKYKIVVLPEVLFPVVENILKELNINFQMKLLKIYERVRNSIDLTKEINPPDTLVLRSLTEEDAKQIDDIWYSKQNGSLEFIKSLIAYNLSMGLYTKDTNELIAWCTRCQSGFIGTLHVKESYRGQGLAMILIESFSRKVIERGENVRTVINVNNLISQKLFNKLDFKYQETVFILNTEP